MLANPHSAACLPVMVSPVNIITGKQAAEWGLANMAVPREQLDEATNQPDRKSVV